MDVQRVTKAIGLTNVKVIRKAEEYVRLCKIRCPTGLGASEACKSAAAIGLACKVLGEGAFNKELAMKTCGATDKIYQAAIQALQNILQVRIEVTSNQLALLFGASDRVSKATDSTLTEYKTKFMEGLSDYERMKADFSSSVFITVAFYLSAQGMKPPLKIDKKQLLDHSDVSMADFSKVCISMKELCFGKKPAANGGLNDVLTEKRRREEEEEHSDLEGEEMASDMRMDEVPGLKKSAKRQKKEEYNVWKDKVLSAPKVAPSKKAKQTSLFDFAKNTTGKNDDTNAEEKEEEETLQNEDTSLSADVKIGNDNEDGDVDTPVESKSLSNKKPTTKAKVATKTKKTATKKSTGTKKPATKKK